MKKSKARNHRSGFGLRSVLHFGLAWLSHRYFRGTAEVKGHVFGPSRRGGLPFDGAVHGAAHLLEPPGRAGAGGLVATHGTAGTRRTGLSLTRNDEKARTSLSLTLTLSPREREARRAPTWVNGEVELDNVRCGRVLRRFRLW